MMELLLHKQPRRSQGEPATAIEWRRNISSLNEETENGGEGTLWRRRVARERSSPEKEKVQARARVQSGLESRFETQSTRVWEWEKSANTALFSFLPQFRSFEGLLRGVEKKKSYKRERDRERYIGKEKERAMREWYRWTRRGWERKSTPPCIITQKRRKKQNSVKSCD